VVVGRVVAHAAEAALLGDRVGIRVEDRVRVAVGEQPLGDVAVVARVAVAVAVGRG
jgi:hypothetical protein